MFVTRLDEVPKWSMPWVRPNGDLTQHVLAVLDRPLLVWQEDHDFDAAGYYADFPANEKGPLIRQVAKLGERPCWRMERIWYPTSESSDEERAAYEAACQDVAGVRMPSRCLDAYVMQAREISGLDAAEEYPELRIDPDDLDEALDWATAGMCVLQQSLPWPFLDILPYAQLDNRPAHRLLYTYASLLSRKHPRKANAWWKAMVFLNPLDNMGARFMAPGGRPRN